MELREKLVDFMHSHVFPAEHAYEEYREQVGPKDSTVPPVVEELKAEARKRGLWNLFLPAESGISQLDYAGLAEITGWSLHLAPRSEEHTSELQSLMRNSYAVFCLKKK